MTRGVQVNGATTEGETPLDWAVAEGQDAIAARLRELGSRPGNLLPRAAIYLAVKTVDEARVRELPKTHPGSKQHPPHRWRMRAHHNRCDPTASIRSCTSLGSSG